MGFTERPLSSEGNRRTQAIGQIDGIYSSPPASESPHRIEADPHAPTVLHRRISHTIPLRGEVFPGYSPAEPPRYQSTASPAASVTRLKYAQLATWFTVCATILGLAL